MGEGTTQEVDFFTEVEKLNELSTQRELAWRSINQRTAPGLDNDWVGFAQVNSQWYRLYKRLYEEAPEPDEIDQQSSYYYATKCRSWIKEDKPVEYKGQKTRLTSNKKGGKRR